MAAAPDSRRPGFALPMVLLLIGLLSVGVATLFSHVDVESRANHDRQARTDAFALAQTALERFALDRGTYGFTAQPPAVSESTRIALPGGYADVVLERIRPAVGTEDALYVIRSRGTRTAGAGVNVPAARHTVAQLVHFHPGSMQVLSAWTALGGIQKNGAAASISGIDRCGAAAAVAGAAVPAPPGFALGGGAAAPIGAPPVTTLGSATQAAAAVRIDWAGIINGAAVVPDVTIPTDPWPSFSNPTDWPIIRIETSGYSIPTSGRGTIIATGDLTIASGLHWDGIVLVGGVIAATGSDAIHGATVSGLDAKLGVAVPVNDAGNGTGTFQYDSCAVATAASRFSSLTLIDNAWTGTWPSW